MRVLMIISLTIVSFSPGFSATQASPKARPMTQQEREIVANLSNLNHEYEAATRDYKASLQKLLATYGRDVARAEQELQKAKQLREEGLVTEREVSAFETTLERAKDRVNDVKTKMAQADAEIAQLPTDEELRKQARQLTREYRRAQASQPICKNWRLIASRTETRKGVTVNIKMTCNQ